MASDSDLFNKFGQNVDAGKIIFKEGEVGDQMYIIQSGSVRVSRNIGGREQVLAILGKGDFFGEMAIVTKEKRTATITTLNKVELLSFNREGFLNMISKNARIALNIIDKLCRRLKNANLHIKHLARKDARGLVALNLLYAFQGAGMEEASLSYDRTVEEFSENLELPIEQVKAYFDEFERSNIVKLAGNKLSLLDTEKLNALAERLGG